MATEEQVLKRFFTRAHERGGNAYPKRFFPRHYKHAETFLKWCAKQGIEDPLDYIDYRFSAADHSGFVPKLHQLRSDRLAQVWVRWRSGEWQNEKQHERLKRSHLQQSVKHLRELTRGQEVAKYHYVLEGKFELCFVESQITGGFDPRSRYCPSCPLAVRCAAKLYQEHGFDVVALRAGRLHALPPEVASVAVQ